MRTCVLNHIDEGDNTMKAITEYFRNAVAASSQGTISYKDNYYSTTTYKQLQDSKLEKKVIDKLVKSKKKSLEKVELTPVIIALKTIQTEYKDAEKIESSLEEMTSVLFMPAQIDEDGKLFMPEEGKMPWIPREYLYPCEEAQLSIGNMEIYDEFFEQTTDKRNQMTNFLQYMKYAFELYEYVTVNSSDSILPTFDDKYYVFIDKTVNATFYIMNLYNHLLKKDDYSLYNKIISGDVEDSKQLISNTDIAKMKVHVGQMNGEYPLSPSQREAMNHFDEIKDGDVIAIKGPPGTGKTTLLQSVVSNLYVERAIARLDAPIIVAASTNNQAVTNIIDSFGKIKKTKDTVFEERWITKVSSFATYFPSSTKQKEAMKKGYQYTDVMGSGFINEIEHEENRNNSKKKFQENYKVFFDEESNFNIALNNIHKRLVLLDKKRTLFLGKMQDIKIFWVNIVIESTF